MVLRTQALQACTETGVRGSLHLATAFRLDPARSTEPQVCWKGHEVNSTTYVGYCDAVLEHSLSLRPVWIENCSRVECLHLRQHRSAGQFVLVLSLLSSLEESSIRSAEIGQKKEEKKPLYSLVWWYRHPCFAAGWLASWRVDHFTGGGWACAQRTKYSNAHNSRYERCTASNRLRYVYDENCVGGNKYPYLSILLFIWM